MSDGRDTQCDNKQQYRLWSAAAAGRTEEAVRLVSEGLAHPNQPFINSAGDGSRWLPLCRAAANGHTATVEALVRLKADVQRAESWGDRNTPLHFAARQGHTATVAKLVELGARPSQRNGYGQSPRELISSWYRTASVLEQAERAERQEPLCAAAQAGRTEEVLRLLEEGAHPSQPGSAGKQPRALAEEAGHRQTAVALEQAEELRRWSRVEDAALPAGTRLRVEGLGDGVYERWERKIFGANAHFLDFGDGAQQVALRSLAPSQWSLLPPLAAPVVTVRALVVTGGEPVEVEGVSLDWSVSQLNAAIAERRGRVAEQQRLVLGDVALDDEDALLSSCGVVDGAEVHALPREVGAAAERHAAATGAAASAGGGVGVIAEGQPPDVRAQRASGGGGSGGRGRGGGGCLCCASRS